MMDTKKMIPHQSKALLSLSLAILMLFLCGCGALFEKEILSVTAAPAPLPAENSQSERITVRNMNELKKALLDLVYSGSGTGTVVFDPNYDGNPPEDMENACWQVRTQDALCVYCVRNISFETEKIVSYYESSVTIDYSSFATDLSGIVQLPYAVGLRELISNAMDENRSALTILINTSSYTVESVRSLALGIYRSNPTICVTEPQLTVSMYSGAGMQRLYEIRFDYGRPEDEVIRCKSQMMNLDITGMLQADSLDPDCRALAACRYLAENCTYSPDSGSGCYDALILNDSNSEGIALAYVEMCRQLGVDCRIVFGNGLDGEKHCWNIVRLDGDYYHVDVTRCSDGDYDAGFLKSDSVMWNDYRWTISSYPACSGTKDYQEIAAVLDALEEPDSGSDAELTEENGEADS